MDEDGDDEEIDIYEGWIPEMISEQQEEDREEEARLTRIMNEEDDSDDPWDDLDFW